MCHTSHTLTLDCCDAVDESTPDASSIETVDTSCVAVANVTTSGLITVRSSGVVTLGGVMFGVLLPPAANTWSVGSFAVITGMVILYCLSEHPDSLPLLFSLLGNTCMHGVNYIKHVV